MRISSVHWAHRHQMDILLIMCLDQIHPDYALLVICVLKVQKHLNLAHVVHIMSCQVNLHACLVNLESFAIN